MTSVLPDVFASCKGIVHNSNFSVFLSKFCQIAFSKHKQNSPHVPLVDLVWRDLREQKGIKTAAEPELLTVQTQEFLIYRAKTGYKLDTNIND